MEVHIINYGAGNIGSVVNMIKHIGGNPIVVSNTSELETAKRIILPGVGSFDSGMQKLLDSGLKEVLEIKVMQSKVPFLGICLGAQLCTEGSEEGVLPGLGWIPGRTMQFQFSSGSKLKIPHMGWNNVEQKKPHPILNGMDERAKFYFVHKYYLAPKNKSDILLSTNYGDKFASALQRENIIAMQFHPEKSHRHGMKILSNFLKIQ